MKKTNFIGMAFILVFVFVLCGTAVFAQSTDPDNPTSLTRNEIQGKNLGDKPVAYYYAFTAGPGILKITADVKSNQYSGYGDMNWQLLDTNFKKIGEDSFAGDKTGKRSVKEIDLAKKQKVILKLTIGEKVADFKLQFGGAVNFADTGTNENIPEISGDNDTTSTQQICMPRNGVIIMTMKDGKKAKIDLSKVQKIEVQ